jgi:DNA-binding transcriptional regulator YiaG
MGADAGADDYPARLLTLEKVYLSSRRTSTRGLLIRVKNMTPVKLKRELQRTGLGQAQLAEKLGVRPAEVADWLAGREAVPNMVAFDIRRMPSLKPPRRT